MVILHPIRLRLTTTPGQSASSQQVSRADILKTIVDFSFHQGSFPMTNPQCEVLVIVLSLRFSSVFLPPAPQPPPLLSIFWCESLVFTLHEFSSWDPSKGHLCIIILLPGNLTSLSFYIEHPQTQCTLGILSFLLVVIWFLHLHEEVG